jgi:trehalose 6-phosphate phosphatase
MNQELHEDIARLASTHILLVACDFDGTLAPIAHSPVDALADERSLAALRALASLESTHAAVISGRARSTLRKKLGRAPGITLIGGHGAEQPTFTAGMVDRRALTALIADLGAIQERFPGAALEPKPTGAAIHYRDVDPRDHARLREEARAAALTIGCPLVRDGLFVVESGLVPTDKGRALRAVVDHVYAHAAIFLGDDVTDEDAFAALRPVDVGVKVGPGASSAGRRVEDHTGVRDILEALVTARAAWLAQRRLTPIDHLAYLSDQRTGALIDPGGRVVWMCAPRFDSPPIFAQLLGGPSAGYFEVAPADNLPPISRGYEKDSMVLRTEHQGFTVRDYLDCSGGRAFQRAGRTDLIRIIERTESGSVPPRIVLRFSPRIDFGRSATRLRDAGGGILVQGSSDPCVLVSPGVSWTIQDDGPNQMAVAILDVPESGLVLELRLGSSSALPARISESHRRKATGLFWSGWAGTLRLPNLHPDLCRRSALALKSLTFGPNGSICAAATCSLPEQIGGVRNWDYRYCWIRDAAMSAAALVHLGSTGHALKYLDWLGGILEDLPGPEQLRPIYTIRGQELGPEGEIPGLAGYADSRPVRVGNGAAHQVQLDVFGVVADLIALLSEASAPLTPEHWSMLDAMVRAVEARWREPDHGIWEIRGPMRHHVHSKVMCWHTVARAVHARELAGEPIPDAHRALALAIRADVSAHGFDAAHEYFTIAYDEPGCDAACLLVGLTGLVSPDDPRFAATVRAVERDLLEHNTVLRYRAADGLPGVEGGFHLCTGWLIEALHLVGRRDEAHALLDAYAAQCGPLGLYAEERDPISGRALGNYPQAYSHLALINACCRLS